MDLKTNAGSATIPLIVCLVVTGAGAGCSSTGPSTNIEQRSEGTCSPPIAANTGQVTVNCLVGSLAPASIKGDRSRAPEYPHSDNPSLAPNPPPFNRRQGGSLVVRNETGGPLKLTVNGKSYSVPHDYLSVEVPAGMRSVVAKARCGAVAAQLDVVEGQSYVGNFSCQTRDVSDKVGYLDVHNNTGAALTVTVAGSTYNVSQSLSSIPLAEGIYALNATARCGATLQRKESQLEIVQGSRSQETYYCTWR